MKRGKPLETRTELKRTRFKRKRRRPRPEGHDDPDYIDFLHSLDCRVAVHLGSRRFCDGPMTAAHVGDRGVGQKCPDRQSVSLCYAHGVTDAHFFGRGSDGKRGFFAAMTKEQRRDWYGEQVAACNSAYFAATGRL
jgi:hypothetical protein